MADYQRANIRVSDTEREDALNKLGQHMTEGRLDLDEYGERTAKVTAAKTRGDVLALFEDLPEPRPAFGRPTPPASPTIAGRGPHPAPARPRGMPAAVPIVLIVLAVALTAVLKWPFFFVLPFIFFFAQRGRWHHG